MIQRLRCACLLIALLAVPSPSTAQETQVPLDVQGAVEEMDAGLARRLGMFVDEYPDLVAVRLFQLPDSAYILEITMRREGRTVRQRIDMTAPEVERLRRQVSDRIAENAPEVVLDQDGRHLLVGTTTLLGLGYWGWAVPAVLNVDDDRIALGTYMLTAGASFLLPYQLTTTRPVTWGMANATRWGATRGILHGLLLHHLLEGDREPQVPAYGSDYDDGWDAYDRRRLATALGLSLAETLAAYAWAAGADMTAGDAHTIGNGGDFGMAWGAEAALVLGLDEDRDRRAVEALVLAGSGIGLGVGAALTRSRNDTWGDAEIVRTGHIVGTLAGAMVADWLDADIDNPTAFGGSLLAGSTAGTYVGMELVRDRDFSVGHGVLVDLGSAAGGLIGLGVAVLAVDDGDATPFLVASTAGAAVGYLATVASLADDARYPAEWQDGSLRGEGEPRDPGGLPDAAVRGSRSLRGDASAQGYGSRQATAGGDVARRHTDSLHLQVSPLGLLRAARSLFGNGAARAGRAGTGPSGRGPTVPVIVVGYTF